jgi:AAA15 family ATPase/GTPase
MIKKLSIKGFKSVRQLDLDCRRVNVFIGEPNTGKTNILEALAFWCPDIIGRNKLRFSSFLSSGRSVYGSRYFKTNSDFSR